MSCNKDKAICLNILKNDMEFLHDINRVITNYPIKSSNQYSYHIQKNGKREEHRFIFKKQKNNNLTVILEDKSKKIPCIKMIFMEQKKYKSLIGFKKSEIEYINRAKCSINKQGKIKDDFVSGTFSIKLANKLNKILGVEESKLKDYAKGQLCNNAIPLKLTSIYKNGKTWYDNVAGFEPVNKDIYKSYNKSKNLKFSKLFEFIDGRDFEIQLLWSWKDDDLKKMFNILKKLNLEKQSTIRSIINTTFSKKSPLNDCDKSFVYDFFFEKISTRHQIKYIKKVKDKEISNFFNFSRLTSMIIISKKIY